MTLYAPGTLEKDPQKQNMALQQHASAIDTVNTTVTANTAAIAANTAAIAAAAPASQAEQEAATNTAKSVTPGRQQYHPSAAKAWVNFDASSGTPTIRSSYNVSSLTDNGVGDTTINFTTPFPANNYCIIAYCDVNSLANTSGRWVQIVAPSTGSCRILTTQIGLAAGEDMEFVNVVIFGDL